MLKDTDPMPNGKYKGVEMANVPASYLLWCYDNNKCSPHVKRYVQDNKEVLIKEINKS